MDKEEFWQTLQEPAVKDCRNCASKHSSCTHEIPDCLDNIFDGSKRPKWWVWDEKTYDENY